MWWLFNWSTLWLLLFLGWSVFCMWVGYSARGNEELTDFIEKHRIRREPPDDPPEKTRV